MKVLPNSITRLELENTFNQLDSFHFPSNLQNLKITGIYALPVLCSHFPTSLVNLSVAWCPIPASFRFPSQLVKLELIRNQYSGWKFLSSYLRKLSVQLEHSEWRDTRWIPLLASGVHELKIVTHSGDPPHEELSVLLKCIEETTTVARVVFCCDSEVLEWNR